MSCDMTQPPRTAFAFQKFRRATSAASRRPAAEHRIVVAEMTRTAHARHEVVAARFDFPRIGQPKGESAACVRARLGQSRAPAREADGLQRVANVPVELTAHHDHMDRGAGREAAARHVHVRLPRLEPVLHPTFGIGRVKQRTVERWRDPQWELDPRTLSVGDTD
jgi:hypothetical protein